MREEILDYCDQSLTILERLSGQEFADNFMALRINFHKRFSWNYIFSTRFGLDFFEETFNRVLYNEPIKNEKSEELAIFDLNFNKWLKNVNSQLKNVDR